MSFKRKSPYASASPPVFSNSGGADNKRARGLGGQPTSTHHNFADPRTATLELHHHLRQALTMPWQDAYFHVELKSPGVDAHQVLELLKKQDRVKYNEQNQVFSYEPELVLRNATDLRAHIRTHSRPDKGVPWKSIKEIMPNNSELTGYMEELEKDGQILILRGLTGKLKDAPLPPLGGENAFGDKINSGGQERWKMIFWDELRERNRTAPRVDNEFIFAWANVKITETEDVAKLLEGQDLKASASSAPPPRKDNGPKDNKKKKRSQRKLKITNEHMKSLGIDFSQDYVPE